MLMNSPCLSKFSKLLLRKQRTVFCFSDQNSLIFKYKFIYIIFIDNRILSYILINSIQIVIQLFNIQ